MGAALTNQDVASQHELTIAALDAQALGHGITAVPGGADALLMCEELKSDLKHWLHLHDVNVLGIFLLQLDEVDHEGGQKRLADLVGFSLQVAGELEGEGSILLVDLDLSLQAQHVVHGALGQAHGAGNGSAEDIFPGVSPSAVALYGEGLDAAALRYKGSLCH